MDTPKLQLQHANEIVNDLNTSRKELPQLVVGNRPAKKGRKGRDIFKHQTPHETNLKCEGHHKHREARESDPTRSPLALETRTGMVSPCNMRL